MPSADALASIAITALPVIELKDGTVTADSAGALELNGAAYTLNTPVPVADLASLVFTPVNRTVGYDGPDDVQGE